MLTVGVIGCGKMADHHFVQIKRLPSCQLVGVCDTEILMARQAALRYGLNNYFDNVDIFLKETEPDVVHITTPPQSHYSLAKKCIEQNRHLYIEKPFALNFEQADEILKLAELKNLKVTVGHNAQFSPAMLKMREMVKSGYLGDTPVHVESYYCYNIENQQYAEALLGDSNHWVRSLPGKLVQNVISHGVAKIAEFMETGNPEIHVISYISPLFQSIGETQITDELRVMIHDRKNTTAFLTFSTQIKPAALHQLRVYGTRNSIFVDHNTQAIYGMDNISYKSYLNYIMPQFTMAGKFIANAFQNMRDFIRKKLYTDYGMFYLVKSFYESITEGKDLPLSYREIRLTELITERIIQEINKQEVSRKQISGSSEELNFLKSDSLYYPTTIFELNQS